MLQQATACDDFAPPDAVRQMPARTQTPLRTAASVAVPGFVEASKGNRRRGINSAEIGLRVLRAIIELDGPAVLKDIAARAGLDTSQAHRYVSSLMNYGLVTQDPSSGRYNLGPASLQIGLAAIARQDAIGAAEAFARDFSQQHSVTTLLSLWGPSGPTIIRWFHGNPPVYTTLSIGSVLPVTRSSTGRVFMAFLPEHMLNTALAREGYEVPLSRNTALMLDREAVRASFTASVDGQVVPGLRVHAAPVLGIDNTVVAVVATAHNDAVPRTADRGLRQRLVAAAVAVGKSLGATLEPTNEP